jgi:hypothetical protein
MYVSMYVCIYWLKTLNNWKIWALEKKTGKIFFPKKNWNFSMSSAGSMCIFVKVLAKSFFTMKTCSRFFFGKQNKTHFVALWPWDGSLEEKVFLLTYVHSFHKLCKVGLLRCNLENNRIHEVMLLQTTVIFSLTDAIDQTQVSVLK